MTTTHPTTRPATVDVVLLLGALVATAGFLLKTLDTWRHQ